MAPPLPPLKKKNPEVLVDFRKNGEVMLPTGVLAFVRFSALLTYTEKRRE